MKKQQKEPIKPGNNPANWSPDVQAKMNAYRRQCGKKDSCGTLEPRKPQEIGGGIVRSIIERPRKQLGKRYDTKAGKWTEYKDFGPTTAKYTKEREAWAAKNKRPSDNWSDKVKKK